MNYSIIRKSIEGVNHVFIGDRDYFDLNHFLNYGSLTHVCTFCYIVNGMYKSDYYLKRIGYDSNWPLIFCYFENARKIQIKIDMELNIHGRVHPNPPMLIGITIDGRDPTSGTNIIRSDLLSPYQVIDVAKQYS